MVNAAMVVIFFMMLFPFQGCVLWLG